jgi:hypothetical protein
MRNHPENDATITGASVEQATFAEILSKDSSRRCADAQLSGKLGKNRGYILVSRTNAALESFGGRDSKRHSSVWFVNLALTLWLDLGQLLDSGRWP